MGWLGKLEDWIEYRKNRKSEFKERTLATRHRKKDLMVRRCNTCGHDKAWYKDGQIKCTKCGKVEWI